MRFNIQPINTSAWINYRRKERKDGLISLKSKSLGTQKLVQQVKLTADPDSMSDTMYGPPINANTYPSPKLLSHMWLRNQNNQTPAQLKNPSVGQREDSKY